MFYAVAFLGVALLRSVASQGYCMPNSTYGCLNGYSYEYATEFPCGSMQNGVQPIYTTSASGCCAQGIPFSKSTNYCCYDGVHDYKTGYCGDWDSDASDPTCYDCTSYVSLEDMALPSLTTSDEPIDTLQPNTGTICTTATSTYGCLNTYEYDYKTQYPCYNYLLSWSSYGCCNGEPYNLQQDSCCYDPSTEVYSVVTGDAHACSCTQYGCDPN